MQKQKGDDEMAELDKKMGIHFDQNFRYKREAIEHCELQFEDLKYCFDIYNVNPKLDLNTCKRVSREYEKCIDQT